MKRNLLFTPNELNDVAYELQEVEKNYQIAKDDYDILEDSSKDLLASIKTGIASQLDTSEAKAETLARDSKEWKEFKLGLYAAQRKLGTIACRYKHLQRVLEILVSGLAFKRETIKKGIDGYI